MIRGETDQNHKLGHHPFKLLNVCDSKRLIATLVPPRNFPENEFILSRSKTSGSILVHETEKNGAGSRLGQCVPQLLKKILLNRLTAKNVRTQNISTIN